MPICGVEFDGCLVTLDGKVLFAIPPVRLAQTVKRIGRCGMLRGIQLKDRDRIVWSLVSVKQLIPERIQLRLSQIIVSAFIIPERIVHFYCSLNSRIVDSSI